MNEIKENEVYTIKENQFLLKVSQSTIMRMIKKGILKAGKFGGQYRILGESY
jgi:excisionase family DNA binding protein